MRLKLEATKNTWYLVTCSPSPKIQHPCYNATDRYLYIQTGKRNLWIIITILHYLPIPRPCHTVQKKKKE